MNRYRLLISLICISALACISCQDTSQTRELPEQAQDETRIEHVDATAAQALLQDQPDIAILDVRTPEEYAKGHLPNSINIDFNADTFAAELEKLDKSQAYLIHCRSGRRSTLALDTFKELGFKDIIHLDGGILAWEQLL